MSESVVEQSFKPLSDHTLLTTFKHNVDSITPFHVSVIKAISQTVHRNPINTCFHLSDHTNIAAIDSLVDSPSSCGDLEGHWFHYSEFGRDLLVGVLSDGLVLVYNRA